MSSLPVKSGDNLIMKEARKLWTVWRMDRFGEDTFYKKRIFVIYDGIHYNPLILEPPSPAGSVNSDCIPDQQRCCSRTSSGDCVGSQGQGQTEAQAHAKATGHINFGEVWYRSFQGRLAVLYNNWFTRYRTSQLLL